MKNIRLATTFSGIGAVEWAFKRLNLKHNIVFACDNGNINIDIDVNEELTLIKKLNKAKLKKQYVDNLYKNNSRKTNFVEITYKNNYDINKDDFHQDIRLLDGNVYKNKVDIFAGGSPCQSFSIAGARAGFEDTRGTLFYDYVRIIKEVKPKVFIFENVFGLLNHDKGKTWEVVQQAFSQLGYFIKWNVCDAKNFNIPQGRRRLFVIGFKKEEWFNKFEFPQSQKLKFTTQDFLLDNCAFGNFTFKKNGELKIIKSSQIVDSKLFLSDLLLKYVLSPGTKNFYHTNAQIDLPIARALLSTQGNSHRASVNNYVTTNGKIRALDPRESLRLMGFTDDFKISVSKAQSYKQSGNSIVVDVLMQIVKKIIDAVGDELYEEN